LTDIHVDPLLDVLRRDRLIDISFLYSVWPEFFRGVRLLIVSVRGRLANQQERIDPSTWTLISDPNVRNPLDYRDIVLKLGHDHFTLLECNDPTNLSHPIGRLLEIMEEVGHSPPQECGHFLLQELRGLRDDPHNDDWLKACAEVGQIQDQMSMLEEFAFEQ
jgi:hypothetical protein